MTIELKDNPAKYSDELFPVFCEALKIHKRVLDPFAGTGKIHLLREMIGIQTVGVELEPEWAGHHPDTIIGDSTQVDFKFNSFDAICTSPAYGNRMADHHNAQEKCKTCGGKGKVNRVNCTKCGGKGNNEYTRYTYRGYLGRPLTDNNAGAMQWGAKYRELHTIVYVRTREWLAQGGAFVLNIKDHERDGERQFVPEWHVATLEKLGYALQWWVNVPTKHNGNGANQGKKYPEQVYVFRKSRPTRREYDAEKRKVGPRYELQNTNSKEN